MFLVTKTCVFFNKNVSCYKSCPTTMNTGQIGGRKKKKREHGATVRRRSKSREGHEKKARLKRSKSSGAVHVKKEGFRHIRDRPRTQSRAAGGRPEAQRRRRGEPSLAEFRAMSLRDQAAYRASLVPRRPMSAHASQSMKRELASTGTGHVQDSTHKRS